MADRLPVSLSASVVVPGIDRLQRVTSSTAQRRELLNRWADDYFQSINARHNLLSTGAGGSEGRWKPLSEATQESRRKRLKKATGVKPKRGVKAILTDTLQLLAATRKKGGPGQIRRFNTKEFRLTLGIGGPKIYQEPTKRASKKRLGTLAAIHAASGRRIIVPPNARVLKKMETAASVWLLKRFKSK